MRSGGCGAAVAHDEDCAVFIAGFEQQVDKIVDFRSVQAVYGIFQLGQIFFNPRGKILHQKRPFRECLL